MSLSHTRRRHFPPGAQPSLPELARRLGWYVVPMVEPVMHLLPPLLRTVADCEFGITRSPVEPRTVARRLGVTISEHEQLLFDALEAARMLHAEHAATDLHYAA